MISIVGKVPAGNEPSLIWLLPLVAERLRDLMIRSAQPPA
jgi:hypothetical protein